MSKKEIVRRLGVSKPTIIAWLKDKVYDEGRGWKKGTARSYTDSLIAERICTLKKERIANQKYFVGSEYVQMDYAKAYPTDTLPSTWYIDQVVRDNQLQTREPPRGKQVGGSQYLLYPAASITALPGIHQSGDYIGKKYIVGSSDPVNIFSAAYYAPFKLHEIWRTPAETGPAAIVCLQTQWQTVPIPDVFRMDNGLQFRGGARGKRFLGLFLRFLLNLNITPLFGSPSKPWTNPYVEGHNRVFNEKIWGRNRFTALSQIDEECNRFNQESRELFDYKYSVVANKGRRRFATDHTIWTTDRLTTTKKKKIFFIRFVESFETRAPAHVTILNQSIRLPEKYVHQFVWIEWDLEKEKLLISSEYEQKLTLIKYLPFTLRV